MEREQRYLTIRKQWREREREEWRLGFTSSSDIIGTDVNRYPVW